jgi:Phosphodiester glycosidase
VAYYVSVKLSDEGLNFSVPMAPDRLTLGDFFSRESRPLLLVNCTFFSPQTNQNLSVVICKGQLLSGNVVALKGIGQDSALYYYPTRGAIGIYRSRRADVAWVFTDSTRRQAYAFEDGPIVATGTNPSPTIDDLKTIAWKRWSVQTAVGGGPVLMHEREIRITRREEQMFPDQAKFKSARTAMGYTADGHLIILAIQGGNGPAGASLEQEAQIMQSLGCSEALNLAGGQSSAMLINGKETIKPAGPGGPQAIPAAFMISVQDLNK